MVFGVLDGDIGVGTRVGAGLVEARGADPETAGLLVLMVILLGDNGRSRALRPGDTHSSESNPSACWAEHGGGFGISRRRREVPETDRSSVNWYSRGCKMNGKIES